jgi:hypothetical protein
MYVYSHLPFASPVQYRYRTNLLYDQLTDLSTTFLLNGWLGWARTSDPLINSQMLLPTELLANYNKMVPQHGFEPRTCRLQGGCSGQLSY